MLSLSLLQLRTVILPPAPDRCVINIETALLQQLLNIAQRQRIAKIPPDRTKYETGFGLPPFEDRGSGSHFPILSRHRPAALKVATHPYRILKTASILRHCTIRTTSRALWLRENSSARMFPRWPYLILRFIIRSRSRLSCTPCRITSIGVTASAGTASMEPRIVTSVSYTHLTLP